MYLENIDSGYNGSTIIQDINLQVNSGDILLIVGPNGSGKSTLLKTIMGFTICKKGCIKYLGQTLSLMQTHARVRMGISYVFQEKRIFNKLTVYENLKIASLYLREDPSRLMDIIYSKYPILYDKKNNDAGWLSGGEQQMLAFARVILQRPKVILFDEPTSALAPGLIENIFSDILEMSQSGITCLIAEHRVKDAIRISNKLLCLNSGRIVYNGDSTLFKNNYMSLYDYFITKN